MSLFVLLTGHAGLAVLLLVAVRPAGSAETPWAGCPAGIVALGATGAGTHTKQAIPDLTSSVSGNSLRRSCFRIWAMGCWEWSVNVHWRPSLSAPIVTQLVTRVCRAHDHLIRRNLHTPRGRARMRTYLRRRAQHLASFVAIERPCKAKIRPLEPLAFWMLTTGACQVRMTSAASRRCLRLSM